MLLKRQYFWKLSIDSVQSLSRFQQHFFREVDKNTPHIYIRPQKTLNSQRNPEKRANRRHHTSTLSFQAIKLKKSTSMVLTYKQRSRPMEQNQEAKSEPKHLWSTNSWQGSQEYSTNSLFSKWCRYNWITGKRIKLDPYVIPLTKMYSK